MILDKEGKCDYKFSRRNIFFKQVFFPQFRGNIYPKN